jgi:class 3 adenylate cyclase/predicted ATPase
MARDIGEWLDGLGLGRYAEAFAENEIDLHSLPHITEEDLKEIGVALGPRRKLLAVIAELGDSDGPATADERLGERYASAEAERRQLTVMFVDLVGSTALAERLDPEDLRKVIRAYQETCAASINRFDGHVAKFIGDGVLAYFGYPQAHEDDARRAVSAGLGIVEGLAALNRSHADGNGIELSVRVGIHTGLVVAGEMGGGETREAEAIVGETPNVAARLEGLAEPNTVAISAATERLVDGLFECDDLGPQTLKGVSEPVRVFRVGGESAAPSRFEAAVERGLTPLIGREEEIGLLLKRWELAKDGEGQVVLLSSEAGVGKSRILRAFYNRLEAEPHSRVLYYCSPYHRNSALYPVIEQVERALRFETSDSSEQKLSKLEAMLGELSLPEAELAPLLALLLSLPAEERYPAFEGSPQLLRRKTLEAMLSIIEAMAVRTPVLMVVEDAHLIDPSTSELLDLCVERLRVARVLILIAFRPDFVAPWGSHAHATALTLNRLSRKESALIVARVTGGKSLPASVLEEIIAKTDGVPLFVEELTKSVLESGLLREEGGQFVLPGPLPPLAIPASLQDSLMARLDRLSSVKEVAQLAATIGRTFGSDLLGAVSPLGEQDLEDALSQLLKAELIYHRNLPTEARYEFKHALVRDAAYHSLLKSSRQQHHARIAQILEEKFPTTADSEPELLAHHYSEANLAEPAARFWLKAGQNAMRRSAHVEGEGHLKKGLEVLESVPPSHQRRRLEIALQNTLGVCLMPTRGFGNADVAKAFERAALISEEESDLHGLFVALRGKGQYQMISGDLRTAREQTGRILTLAEELNDPGILIEAHHLGWSALTFTGDFAAAQRHAEYGVAHYDRERDHQLTFAYSGHDPGVCCRSFGSLALWQLGYPDQALSVCRDGENLAQELSHPFTITVAFWGTGILRLLRREIRPTLETGDAMIAHCSEMGLPAFIPMGRIFRGGALAKEGAFEEGLAELREGIAGVRQMGTQYTVPLFFAWLAELCFQSGAIEDGLSALEEGLALSEQCEDRFSLPEFHRIKGEALLARGADNRVEAEACFKRAIETAQRQEARLMMLRSATSLARFWGENRRRSEARALLGPHYEWFTEGFNTHDLKDAKALLDELS